MHESYDTFVTIVHDDRQLSASLHTLEHAFAIKRFTPALTNMTQKVSKIFCPQEIIGHSPIFVCSRGRMDVIDIHSLQVQQSIVTKSVTLVAFFERLVFILCNDNTVTVVHLATNMTLKTIFIYNHSDVLSMDGWRNPVTGQLCLVVTKKNSLHSFNLSNGHEDFVITLSDNDFYVMTMIPFATSEHIVQVVRSRNDDSKEMSLFNLVTKKQRTIMCQNSPFLRIACQRTNIFFLNGTTVFLYNIQTRSKKKVIELNKETPVLDLAVLGNCLTILHSTDKATIEYSVWHAVTFSLIKRNTVAVNGKVARVFFSRFIGSKLASSCKMQQNLIHISRFYDIQFSLNN